MASKKTISFQNDYLDSQLNERHSCIVLEHHRHHLAFHPYHLGNINESIKEVLNAAVGKFDKKLDGILLSYRNIKLLSNVAPIINDNYYIHFDIEADFYLFKPKVGCTLLGVVNKISREHVGCLVHNYFNVSILHPRNDSDQVWLGTSASLEQIAVLKITYMELESRLPYIRADFISVLGNGQNDSGEKDSAEKDSGVSTGDEANTKTGNSKDQKRKKKLEDSFHNQPDVEPDSDSSAAARKSSKKKKKKKKKKKERMSSDEEDRDKEQEQSEEDRREKKRKHKKTHEKSQRNVEEMSESADPDSSRKKKKRKKSRKDSDRDEEREEKEENLQRLQKAGRKSSERNFLLDKFLEDSCAVNDVIPPSYELIPPGQIKREEEGGEKRYESESEEKSFWKLPPDPEMEEIFKKPLDRGFMFSQESGSDAFETVSVKKEKSSGKKRDREEEDGDSQNGEFYVRKTKKRSRNDS